MTAAKAILMGVSLLFCFAAFVTMWIVVGALAFVVGRWCAKLMGWY